MPELARFRPCLVGRSAVSHPRSRSRFKSTSSRRRVKQAALCERWCDDGRMWGCCCTPLVVASVQGAACTQEQLSSLFIHTVVTVVHLAEFPMFTNCTVPVPGFHLQSYLSSRWSGTPSCWSGVLVVVARCRRAAHIRWSGTPHRSTRPMPLSVLQSRVSAQLPVWYGQTLY
jgi:hypothetical protein